jgi:DNA-binding NtrC family response regulator
MSSPEYVAKGERIKPLIFLVDDDDNVLSSLKVTLGRRYTVATCNNPVQAVREIKAKTPDIIVLDIKMPEHDGFWVFSEIRKFDKKVPIIFNSAYQDVMGQQDLQDAYAPFGHLPKTGNLGDFLALLQKAAKHAGW